MKTQGSLFFALAGKAEKTSEVVAKASSRVVMGLDIGMVNPFELFLLLMTIVLYK